MHLPSATRRRINEEQVRYFFGGWDPSWRWVLILGLRDLRANMDRLGRLASEETGNSSWQADDYLYGPLAYGITAAAVNEATQHAEDLFALLSFLREPYRFAAKMGSYEAGKVTGLADKLGRDSDVELAGRFCFPSLDQLEAGLVHAADPAAALDDARRSAERLGSLVRNVVSFYKTYDFFHVQYKHGLKIRLRPFGSLPPRTIGERRDNVSAPLYALTTEPLSKVLKRTPGQRGVSFQAGPESLAHVTELLADRNLLRLQLAGPPVDLDDVVGHSWTVSRLLRIAEANRLALGRLDSQGQQSFVLPADDDDATLQVTIAPRRALDLNDVQTP